MYIRKSAAAGIPVIEGYGLSETTAATHTNLPVSPRYGTVGKALPGLQVRLGDDGEVLVKGPSVMRGYWNLPEATAEAFDEEGYFRTGDLGAIDKEGFLTITGRKKEIVVTAGGKNIAPRAIENALRVGRFVSQVVVCGDRRPYLVALLTLDEQAAVCWARENDRDTSPAALAERLGWRQLKEEEEMNDEEIKATFLKPVRMIVFAWNAKREIDTVMTPRDSIKYHKQLLQTSFVSMDPKTAEVKCWVGGNDFTWFKFDHVTAKRQVGSTFKPLLYSIAVQDAGYTPESYISGGPLTLGGKTISGGGGTMAHCLAKSLNAAAWHLMGMIGVKRTIEFAQQCGIKRKLPPYPSIALGAAEIPMLEMLQAYSMFPNRGDVDAAVASEYPAIQLFLERARQLQPDFSLSHQAQAVTRLCQLVDGLPLALELAVTWIRTLSVAEIVVEIERGIDFLATNLRDIPASHRSLRAVFDYSWQLLTPQEQEAYCRLACFRGGFTYEAAQAVAHLNLKALVGLVDKSLLRRGNNNRYLRHPLLLQFASDKLSENPTLAAEVRQSHAHYFGDFIQAQEPLIFGGRADTALKRVQREMENLRQVWTYAIEQRDTPLINRWPTVSCRFLIFKGCIGKGWHWQNG